MHQPGRNVALGSAVDSLTTALVGRWSDPMSEPPCAREREHGFERPVGQNLWRLESFVKQVGEFASCRKPRLFLVVRNFHTGVVFEVLLLLDCDGCSKFFFQRLLQTRESERWRG